MSARDLQSKQRARILDLICEGQPAGLCGADGTLLSYADRNKGILLDLTPIQNSDGTIAIPDIKTDFRQGTATQTTITGFPASEQEITVEEQVKKMGDTWANAVQRTITTGSHTVVRVSLRIPALFQYDDKGNRSGAEVGFYIELKLSSESDWQQIVGSNPDDFGGHDGLIQGEALSPYVRSYRIPLYGDGPWDIRVARESADAADPTKLQSELWWQSYTLITERNISYRHSCVAAIEQPAETSTRILPRAFRMKGSMVRVPSNYNPETRCYAGTWDGLFTGADVTLTADYTAGSLTMAVSALSAALPNNSPIMIVHGGVTSRAYLNGDHAIGATTLDIFDSPIPRDIPSGATGRGFILKWTNNPAWMYYDLSTHPRYGTGDYVPDATVDRWTLYTISRYCDGVDSDGNFVGVPDGKGGYEPRFACSVYIATASDAYRVLSDLASTFRAIVFWSSGLVMAVQDSPKSPKYSFTNANSISGEFTYSSSARKARHTQCNVRWNDPDDFFRPKIEQVPGEQEDIDRWGLRETNVTAYGCTSRGQAIRVGKWILLTEKYEKSTVSFRSGLEGARCRPGDIIRIRDRFKTVNRMGGRVKSIGSGTIELDAPAVISTTDYTLVVTLQNGELVSLPITSSVGTHQTLAVTGDLTGIVPNAVWLLRSPALEPTLWRILNVKERDRKAFDVTALQYVEGKFDEVELGIALTVPPTSDLPTYAPPVAPGALILTEATRKTAEKLERTINIAWGAADGAKRGYLVEMRKPGREWLEIANEVQNITIPPIVVSDLGRYEFRVTTLGYYKARSAPTAGFIDIGEVAPPPTPDDFAALGIAGGFLLSWVDDIGATGYYKLYVSTVAVQPSDPAAIIPGGTTEWPMLGFEEGDHRYFWLVAVLHRIELESSPAGPVDNTSLDPSAKLVVLTSDSQVFQIAKDGTITPASINFEAFGQNLSGSPVFSVFSGTATLTGTGTTRALAYTDLTTEAATIKVAWDGQEDYISISKVREGADAIVALLTNEAHTVPADAAGVVSSFSGAATQIVIFKGAADDSAAWTISKADTNCTSALSGTGDRTCTVSALTADVGYVDITAAQTGYPSITKRFTVTKSKTGAQGADGGFIDHVFIRATSLPSTPTGDGLPSGWSDGPPTGTNPLWMSTATKTAADVLVGAWSTPVRLDGAAGSAGADAPYLQAEYSADGISSWHGTPSGSDFYLRTSSDGGSSWSGAVKIRGEDGTNGVDGANGADGGFVDYVFKRAASIPSTPTGDGTPSGWNDGPPAGSDPLWVSTSFKTASNTLVGSWATPVRLDGANGTDGSNGTNGDSVYVEYSVDGSTSWHSTFTTGDIYMHVKIGTGGSYSSAIRIVGEAGTNGTNGSNGADGTSIHTIFAVAFAQPSTPTGDTPSGWTDGVPGGTGAKWQSNGTFNSAGHLVGSWSTPERISGTATYTLSTDPAGSPTNADMLPGDIWFDTSLGSDKVHVKVRNAANTGYDDNTLDFLAVSKLGAGTIQAITIVLASGGEFKSDDYVAGTSGFKLSGAGGLEIFSALIRAFLSNGSSFYNPAYGTNSSFPAKCALSADDSSARSINGTDRISLVTVYGWATGTGFAKNRFGLATTIFEVNVYSSFSFGSTSDYADLSACYRINGGSWVDFAPSMRNNFYSGGSARTGDIIEIAGFSGSDYIEFGRKVVTPASLSYQYSQATVGWSNA